jgi:hypothetical protein
LSHARINHILPPGEYDSKKNFRYEGQLKSE